MSEAPTSGACDQVFPGQDCVTAGPVRRILATLVDMVVFCGMSAVIAWPMLRDAPLPEGGNALDVMASAAGDVTWISHASGVIGLWVALWWCYFLVGWGLIGGTPGKLTFGLRVVDHRGRCPIGASRAALRLIAYVASSVTIVVGHSMAAFRADQRTLHDILAGTRVVRWRKKHIRGSNEED